MNSVIKVENLKKYYKTYEKEEGFWGTIKSFFKRKTKIIKAVNDISFSLSSGEIVGFIGPNGAGKTTTLKCLSGILYPDSGKISVLGYTPFERKKEFLKQIAFIMGQKTQLFWDLPAIESYRLYKEIYEVSEEDFKKTLSDLSELLDFKDYLYQPVRNLSLGQRMKAEIIAPLIHNPKILFLDEPTIGLDVVMQKNIRDFIKRYNEKYKATIILTSHYMEDVETLCERIIIIDKGKIYYDGSLKQLKDEYIKTKEIEVTFLNPITNKKEEFKKLGDIKSISEYSLTLEVKKEKIPVTINYILKNFRIVDMSIKELDIAEIIREVFTKNL